jgi:Zn-dependent peptidase ImmA (M78 family)
VSGNTTLISGRHCIFVNGRHTLERQRFTILHEIAHILLCLPSIHDSVIRSAILMGYTKRPPEEICCAAFAAECLLPYDFFKKDVHRYPVGFGSVEQLAADYEASLTCTGSRCAVVNGVFAEYV